jgi:threonine dehydratase
MMEVTFEDIEQAAERIKGVVRHTPLEHSRWLSNDERKVSLKLECFQATGSFKLRGAMARISSLTEEERRRGILTVSAGNHGLAVAHCAERLRLDATIVVPRTGSPAKIEAIRRYGVTLLARGENYDEAEREAREMERASGKVFVSPYNDPFVIAGQGTVAMEMMADDADIDAIVVPTSGGGLLAGVLISAKTINPRIKVYGAEPAASPTMKRSLEAGRIVEIEEDATIADGLAGNIEPGSITFPIIERLVDEIILVEEDDIKRAIARAAREDHLIIEGAAATGIAALDRAPSGRVAAIVTGRNIAMELFNEIARRY